MREIKRFEGGELEYPAQLQLRGLVEGLQQSIDGENPPKSLLSLLEVGIKGIIPLLPRDKQGELMFRELPHLERELEREERGLGEGVDYQKLYSYRLGEYLEVLQRNTLQLKKGKSYLRQFRLLLVPLKKVVEEGSSPLFYRRYTLLLNLYFYTYRLLEGQISPPPTTSSNRAQ